MTDAEIPAWIHKLVASARSRAKARFIPFQLTERDVVELFRQQNGKCYWFKVDLFCSEQRRHPRLPSLDRVNSDKGYCYGNVVLACWAANQAKSNLDPLDWEEFLDHLKAAMTGEV